MRFFTSSAKAPNHAMQLTASARHARCCQPADLPPPPFRSGHAALRRYLILFSLGVFVHTMDHSEIHSATDELCAIIRRDPEDIDFADVNREFARIAKAGAPINHDSKLREMRDEVYDRISRLKGWPMSDSSERAKFLHESMPFIRAIAVEAYVLDKPNQ